MVCLADCHGFAVLCAVMLCNCLWCFPCLACMLSIFYFIFSNIIFILIFCLLFWRWMYYVRYIYFSWTNNTNRQVHEPEGQRCSSQTEQVAPGKCWTSGRHSRRDRSCRCDRRSCQYRCSDSCHCPQNRSPSDQLPIVGPDTPVHPHSMTKTHYRHGYALKMLPL